jgi:hypothetical protein
MEFSLSIPSPKMKGYRAFDVELLSTKTINSNRAKAHERYCSTVTVSDPVSVEDDTAATEPYGVRGAVYPGSGDNVEHRALDRAWGQLSNESTVLSPPLDWATILWTIVRSLLKPDGEYVLAGDEAVISKAGKTTLSADGSIRVWHNVRLTVRRLWRYR